MKTDIEFLDQLGQDLVAAANTEGVERGRASRPPVLASRRARLTAAVATSVLILAGVVGYFVTRPHTSSPTARAGPVHGPAAFPTPAPDTPQGGSSITAQFGSSKGASTIGPSVIKTGQIALKVPKGTFSEAFASATQVAVKYEGFVQTSSTEGDRTKTGTLLIQVPAGSFELAINDLSALGSLQLKTIHGEDVTAQFVDLGARLRNAQQEEIVLQKLLDKAPTVADTLSVEGQVSDVELQIEELQGQIRVLSRQADYGSIQVSLFEQASTPTPSHTHQGFGSAWRKSVDGFFGVATSVVVGLGYVLPLGVLVALVWLVLRRVRRARVVG